MSNYDMDAIQRKQDQDEEILNPKSIEKKEFQTPERRLERQPVNAYPKTSDQLYERIRVKPARKHSHKVLGPITQEELSPVLEEQMN